MKNLLLLSLCLIGLSTIAVPIQTWHTPEGARVLFSKTNALAIVDINLVFDAASSRDGSLFGLAKLTANMIGTKSKYHNQKQITAAFSELGAEFSSTALKDMTIISLRSLSEAKILTPAVRLLSEVLSDAVFDNKILSRIKTQAKSAIIGNDDKPGTVLQQAFAKHLFKPHPYAHPSVGTTQTLNLIKLRHIKNHYQQYYTASNLDIVIVGDLTTAQAKSIARQLSHRLNIGKKPLPLKLTAPKPPLNKHINYNSTQSHLIIGSLGINRSDKNYHSLYLANHIFGGGGLTSMLNDVIREKNGLAYSVYSYFQPLKAGGFFAIKLQTKNSSLNRAKQLVLQTLNDFVKNGINEQTLADAKNYIIGSFALRTASNAQITQYLSLIAFYDLPLNYLNSFPNKIKQLSLKEVQLAAQDYFTNQPWQIISIGK